MVKLHITLQTENSYYLPILPFLPPNLSFISIIHSRKVELSLMNIQISTRSLYGNNLNARKKLSGQALGLKITRTGDGPSVLRALVLAIP